MLIIAGLGLYSLRDLPLGVVETARSADFVYLEEYTSFVPGFNLEALERLLGKKVERVTRHELEDLSGRTLIEHARTHTVLLLAPGNPLVATTHASLIVEARRAGVPVRVLPAPSVVDGVVCSTGLHIYRFGRPVTLVMPDAERGFYPYSTYCVIKNNLRRGLHTLVLLDLRRDAGLELFMDVASAARTLLEMEELYREGVLSEETLAIGVARATAPDELIKVAHLAELARIDFGGPPHSLVIPGLLHDSEIEYLSMVHGADVEVMLRWNSYVKAKYADTLEL